MNFGNMYVINLLKWGVHTQPKTINYYSKPIWFLIGYEIYVFRSKSILLLGLFQALPDNISLCNLL